MQDFLMMLEDTLECATALEEEEHNIACPATPRSTIPLLSTALVDKQTIYP
jgi:hypothetical protein